MINERQVQSINDMMIFHDSLKNDLKVLLSIKRNGKQMNLEYMFR
jgi:hypothetical protein